MNNDSGIISFQHCNHKNIYCINIPTNCPVCKICLKNLQNIPIRVPYPFVRASQQPCAIIVKPTCGNFLNNYQLMDDLHIGVTTSRGTVISYDWNGIIEDTENWQGCLVVFQLNDHCMETHWDTILTDIIKNECWNSSRYNEEDHNCFSFIIAFLKQFNTFKSPVHHIETREDFAELYVAPTTIKAYKYIYLYRKIIENGFYIYSQPSNEILSIQ
ncbi:MKRN2 opposite strand protein [Rhopalosiphum maidis]|uniref:MKRN2 opposite strand protein n=1 Tax=Rhopalosiphum maidis TaxID=43146 RepID=UPI000F0037B3|nr:MKRN2 opposite strand protein [Rhopalosiphum maidis]